MPIRRRGVDARLHIDLYVQTSECCRHGEEDVEPCRSIMRSLFTFPINITRHTKTQVSAPKPLPYRPTNLNFASKARSSGYVTNAAPTTADRHNEPCLMIHGTSGLSLLRIQSNDPIVLMLRLRCHCNPSWPLWPLPRPDSAKLSF